MGTWRFTIANGRRRPAEARLGGGWLCLATIPGPAAESASHWEMLAANASLPGLAKLALDPMTGQPQLRAEAPVETDTDCLEQLAAACAGFERGVTLLCAAGAGNQRETAVASTAEVSTAATPMGRNRAESRSATATEDALPATAMVGAELVELCVEAGWQPLRHDDDGCIVQLESTGTPLSARLSARAGGLRARAELLGCGPLKPPSRAALARLLLAAGGSVRMVRASVDANGDGPSAGIEVICGPRPSPAFVGHALASLSLVARLAAAESRALADPSMARRYLRMQERAAGMGDGARAPATRPDKAEHERRRTSAGGTPAMTPSTPISRSNECGERP
jgi:hypothetical protein